MADPRTVSFTLMKDGTFADYQLLAELEKPFHALTADRILDELGRHGAATPDTTRCRWRISNRWSARYSRARLMTWR